jgi:hypothetical protein
MPTGGELPGFARNFVAEMTRAAANFAAASEEQLFVWFHL